MYSTYLGGSGADQGTGVAVNDAGEVFVGGITASVTLLAGFIPRTRRERFAPI